MVRHTAWNAKFRNWNNLVGCVLVVDSGCPLMFAEVFLVNETLPQRARLKGAVVVIAVIVVATAAAVAAVAVVQV